MAESEHAALCVPCSAGDLKKNAYAMLKGHPCKITEIRVSKTGKHGHAKCSITGVCVLTGKKYQDVQPSHASMHHALVEKKEYQLLNIRVEDNIAELLDEDNQQTEVSLEGEVGEELAKAYNPEDTDCDIKVTVLTAPEDLTGVVVKKEIVCAWKKERAEN